MLNQPENESRNYMTWMTSSRLIIGTFFSVLDLEPTSIMINSMIGHQVQLTRIISNATCCHLQCETIELCMHGLRNFRWKGAGVSNCRSAANLLGGTRATDASSRSVETVSH